MKIAVVTANLGEFEQRGIYVPQNISHDFRCFYDDDYLPRFCSMTPRLQARIVKMFMWQFMPGYDYYLWVDSSCVLARKDSIAWFIEKLGKADIAVFKHPNRITVQEEANYLKKRLSISCPYILPRYTNEDIDGQLKEVNPQGLLFASTAFIYRLSDRVKIAMKEWWYHTSRYHSIDQLSLYHAIKYANLSFTVILESYTKIPYLKYVRNKRFNHPVLYG